MVFLSCEEVIDDWLSCGYPRSKISRTSSCLLLNPYFLFLLLNILGIFDIFPKFSKYYRHKLSLHLLTDLHLTITEEHLCALGKESQGEDLVFIQDKQAVDLVNSSGALAFVNLRQLKVDLGHVFLV